MKQQRALALIAIPVALITACGSQDQQRTAGNDPLPQTLSASSKPAAAPRPAQVVQERVCGAFDALTRLTHSAITPDPDPSNPKPKPNGANLINYANTLQTLDRQGLSAPMNAALTAHAYALTNLGALINHGASGEDIASMATVTDTTSRTIEALCDKA